MNVKALVYGVKSSPFHEC